VAEYDHKISTRALEEFCRTLPNDRITFDTELSLFIRKLYAISGKGDTKYFLDKTPRYHLIVNEIIRLFPDGKFIFLWRNPLAIAASIIERNASRKKWDIHIHDVDLYKGFANLVEAYQKNKAQVCSIRYEELLLHPHRTLRHVFEYLELPYETVALSRFTDVRLEGSMGDPIGTRAYNFLSTEPLTKWRGVMSNPYRKRWGRRYLDWIGVERLASIGYDKKQLTNELQALPFSSQNIFSDFVRKARYGR
jgi:hypothetical protein